MMRKRLLLLSLCLSVAVAVNVSVQTTYGEVVGFVNDDTQFFFGIPFAAPPVSELRFKPPQKPKPWSAPLVTQHYSPACIQDGDQLNLYGPKSEDCLYLNVFAPSNATAGSNLPVVVWIYGGSFVHGGTALFLYDGRNLAKHANIIVVTVNYRLGVFGFAVNDALAKEDPSFPTSGNYGLLDQQLAMSFVKDNIKAFGGDSQRVSIWGESAGAISVCFHMVMPSSFKLYNQAMMDSGPCLQGAKPREFANATSQRLATSQVIQAVNCSRTNPQDSIACLRATNASTLLTAQSSYEWAPIIDQFIIPADPLSLFNDGRQSGVPVFIGTNTNEGRMFVPESTTNDSWHYTIQTLFPLSSVAIEQLYDPVQYFNGNYYYSLAAIETDQFFYCPTRRLLRQQSMVQPKVFQYLFQHVPDWVITAKCPGSVWCSYKDWGVFHTAELFFAWGNFDPFDPPTPDEQTLSQTMMDYWSSFIKYGAPTSSETPVVWQQFQPANYFQNLNITVSSGALYKDTICDFWDSITR